MKREDIRQTDEGFILSIPDFDVAQTLTSGQVFRYEEKEDGTFRLYSRDKTLVLSQEGQEVTFSDTNREDLETYWWTYFDLDTDYGAIKSKLAETSPEMAQAISYGPGVRILKQDPFETTINFIVSANNHIPRIRKIVACLADRYGGEKIAPSGHVYRAFPSPDALQGLDPLEVRTHCGAGFRDTRIVGAAKRFYHGDFSVEEARTLGTPDLKKALLEFEGIGPKVSDCILLYGFYRTESFPSDVWIVRIVETLFLKRKSTPKEVAALSRDVFGPLSGYAQQYLFFYGRETAIGK